MSDISAPPGNPHVAAAAAILQRAQADYENAIRASVAAANDGPAPAPAVPSESRPAGALPPGFENFALALETVERAPEVVFGTGVDPMRPGDVTYAPGAVKAPPRCPLCETYLYPVLTNPLGDTLFECLNEGYEAVYRANTDKWEQRPHRSPDGWKAPLRGPKPPAAVAPPAEPVVVDAPSRAVTSEVVETPKPVRQPMAPLSEAVSGDDLDAEWLSYNEASSISGKTAREIYNMARRGVLPHKRGPKGLVLVNMDVLMKLTEGEST